jgi:hypothetical protein
MALARSSERVSCDWATRSILVIDNMIKAAALRINADCDMFMMFLYIISVVVNQFVYMRLHKNIYKKRAKVINI